MNLKLNLLPLIAIVILSLAVIFCLIGAASSDKGWAKTDHVDIGWKKGCVRSHCSNLSNDMEKGGDAAIAGSIIGLLFGLVAIGVAVVAVLGLGPYFIICLADAIFIAFTGLIVFICACSWAGITQDERDDIDADPDYAFALSIIAVILFWVSAAIMGVAMKFPVTLCGKK